MSTFNLRKSFRKTFFRLFALASLAFAFVMLPGCGKKEADDDDDDDDDLEELAAGNRTRSSKNAVGMAKTQLRLIEDALDQYCLDVGVYPSDLQGLVQNIDESERWQGPYLKQPVLPKDPWGRDYIYFYPGEHNPESYDLYSLGKDNLEGGKGENADFVNWATDEDAYR